MLGAAYVVDEPTAVNFSEVHCSLLQPSPLLSLKMSTIKGLRQGVTLRVTAKVEYISGQNA